MRASLLLLFSSSVGQPSPSLAVTDVAAPWKASPDAPDGQGQKFGLLDRRRRRSAINRAQDHGRNAYARKQDGKKVMTWISIVVLLKILFFFRSFASPFFDPLGEPRKATASSVYWKLMACLYIWLASATLLTALPRFSSNYNIIIATALFFYMFFLSTCSLMLGRLVIRASYYVWQLWRLSGGSVSALVAAFKLRTEEDDERKPLTRESRSFSFLAMEAVKNEPRKKRLPELVKFQRPFRRLARSALVLSASLCVVYLHCWSRTLSAFDTSRGGGLVCQGIFLPLQVLSLLVDQTSSLAACEQEGTCASEQLIWVLWALGISSHLFYYLINEFAGKHHKDYREPSIARKSSDSDITQNGSGAEMSDEDDDDGNVGLESNLSSPRSNQHGTMRRETWPSIAAATIQRLRQKDEQQPQDILPMVSWYSNMIFATGFDMLLASKVFLGRFDERKMQYALLRGTKGPTSETELARPLFDFSKERRSEGDSDGFWFDWMSDCGDGFHSSYQVARLLAQPSLDVVSPSHGTRALPRGKLLVIGGDLAYPGPTPFNYEQRFFRTFEDAMSPPPSYRKEHISIKKPALPVKGWDVDAVAGDDGDALQNYEGPVTFIIPGNHDWFDGLAAYTRYILSRDWLGGWLIPQRTSYFALKLPKNWWLLGFDLALDDDINIEQKDDNVVVASHVPHWVLEDYEEFKHDEKETNLRELINSFLKNRVRLRLAGDLHHYTRHIPCAERSVQPQLVVSGGGGAFLHPTHTFGDRIKVGKDKLEYVRVTSYPNAKESLCLSWLNLWKFRWRNFRLDILWAITHFGMCASLFPLCGVYEDFIESNASHQLSSLLTFVFTRVLKLFGRIFLTGRVSLIFALAFAGSAYGFTDDSNLKTRTAVLWSMAHAFGQIFVALACLLFVEILAEFVIEEGLVATEDVVGMEADLSCSTAMASSIFDEYESRFKSDISDASIFAEPPDLLPSRRFDDSIYDSVSQTLKWLVREVPFLKMTLALFDLPGTIAATHVQMCAVLCADGAYCLYKNDHMLYHQLDRYTILKYGISIGLYYIVFVVPLAGSLFGTWLALSLNWLKCQYDAGFSSLRMEHWKNFLRLHIDDKGDLEIFAICSHRVPKKWRRDPKSRPSTAAQPSWKWRHPSKWIPHRESQKFKPRLIDYTKIKKL